MSFLLLVPGLRPRLSFLFRSRDWEFLRRESEFFSRPREVVRFEPFLLCWEGVLDGCICLGCSGFAIEGVATWALNVISASPGGRLRVVLIRCPGICRGCVFLNSMWDSSSVMQRIMSSFLMIFPIIWFSLTQVPKAWAHFGDNKYTDNWRIVV